ncbi:diguanylate cyclase [Effusibacillus consociatus]|uniref:Diguanylate cyclase n=1 Tax=Effusibacillus consociatus TaxID=1117041 RepID=A0ABV9PYL5_9BACL
MGLNRKHVLCLYEVLCYTIFGILFYANFREITNKEWVAIVTLTGIATLFELRQIRLPSGERLSIVTPLLFTAGILYGIEPIFLIVLLMATIIIINRPKSWNLILFNSVQFGLSAFAALCAFQMAGGRIGFFDLQESNTYLSFAFVYFFTNVFLISFYMTIRSGAPIQETLRKLLEKQSVLIYCTMMTFGLLMTIVVEAEGMGGVILLSIILWFLGVTYRHYYEMYDHFRSLSIKDELTGLYNHRYFQEKLTEVIMDGDTVSLLLLDLDYFKIYNDMYGHPQGDKLLQEVSEVISKHIPDQGIFCRYGGEEFAVILPGQGGDEALAVAESIRLGVSEHNFDGIEHMPKQRITVSIGVSSYPDMASSKENLIILADEALYKVKYTSRNKVQLYSSVVDELNSHFQFGSEETELIQTIKTFLTIINSKDRYTYGHTERDMEYAEALARKIGLSEEEIKIIRYGALLHDIGKVEVPTDILNKKSRLTEEEWEIMKMHVIWGEEIVRPIRALAPCLPIIRHHHERYDGKGYPDGLTGANIPLSARILTIVDSFDAMTTNRPYQKTKTIPEAIDELRRCAGTQFDPELVEPFIEVIKKLRAGQVEKYA